MVLRIGPRSSVSLVSQRKGRDIWSQLVIYKAGGNRELMGFSIE